MLEPEAVDPELLLKEEEGEEVDDDDLDDDCLLYTSPSPRD